MTNIEGCGACGALITPNGSPQERDWAGSLTPHRKDTQGGSGPAGEYHSKRRQKQYFLWFFFLPVTRKRHCSLLVLNGHWDFNDNRENKLSFRFFFERTGLVL